MNAELPTGYSYCMTDILRNVWLFRDDKRQSKCYEVAPYSVTLKTHGRYNIASLEDVRKAADAR